MTELATLGRAPAPTCRPSLVATCHDFETAELEAPEVRQPRTQSVAVSILPPTAGHGHNQTGLVTVADAADPPSQEPAESAATVLERQYAAMQILLAEEKERDAVASRVHRLAVRRLARPPRVEVPSQ